jgi:hypothetical protein
MNHYGLISVIIPLPKKHFDHQRISDFPQLTDPVAFRSTFLYCLEGLALADDQLGRSYEQPSSETAGRTRILTINTTRLRPRRECCFVMVCLCDLGRPETFGGYHGFVYFDWPFCRQPLCPTLFSSGYQCCCILYSLALPSWPRLPSLPSASRSLAVP